MRRYIWEGVCRKVKEVGTIAIATVQYIASRHHPTIPKHHTIPSGASGLGSLVQRHLSRSRVVC